MAGLKTSPNDLNVEEFLGSVEHPTRRADAFSLLSMMKEITGEQALMWGNSIVGFGSYHYKYPSGREGSWFLTGFSPRKASLTLYLMGGFVDYEDMREKLGKHKVGKACLYVNKLADINEDVLKQMIEKSVESIKQRYK